MEIIQGGVTAAKGFKAAGMNAGIKNKTKKDMAMIFLKNHVLQQVHLQQIKYLQLL